LVIPVILFLVGRRMCCELHAAERVDAIQHAGKEEAEREQPALAGPAPP
jgi:hypothetical protein